MLPGVRQVTQTGLKRSTPPCCFTVFLFIQVILAGGAQAQNILWQVGSAATLGTNSIFKGTIMALQSITLDTGANLQGRALALNAAVTFDTNVVTAP